MKKILLLMTMVLTCVGAWAGVTPETGKYYIIKGDHATHHWLTDVVENGGIDVSNNKDNAGVYLKTENGFQAHATGKFLGMNGSQISLVSTGTDVTLESASNGKFYIKVGSHYLYNNHADYTRESEIKTADNSNRLTWEFEEVSPKKYCLTDNLGNVFTGVFFGQELPAFSGLEYELKETIWDGSSLSACIEYRNLPFPLSGSDVTNPTLIAQGVSWGNENKKWRAVEGYVKVKTATVSYTDVDAFWAIYPKLIDGKFKFEIKNLGTGTFVKADPNAVGNAGNGSDVTGATKRVSLAEKGTAFEYKVRTGSNYHFAYNNESGTELRLSMNGSGDSDVFLGVYSGAHSGNDVAFPDYIALFSSLPFPISTPSITNPTMISTYNYGTMSPGNFKWYASGNNVKVERENEKVENGRGVTNSNVATHLWCIYPVVNNGELKFQIKNFATGQYINSTANQNIHDGTTVTLSNEASNFTLGSRSGEGIEFINSSDKRLSVNSSGENKGEQNVGTHSTHYGTAVTFPPISYTVIVSGVGYASLYTPIAGTLNATACAITEDELENGYVRLKEMNDGTATAIPANQGAIVVGEGTYTFTASDVEADWSGNLLSGSAVNTYVEGAAYVLSNKNGIGLYLAELNKDASGATGTTHFLNNAGKAYLKLPTASPVKAFLFEDGETTAIETIETENVNAPIYDLSGRRVVNTVKGGIYIQNGKKFIVK